MRTYYSQKDPKWAGIQLGVCKNETIGKSGCAITSLCNFFVSTSSNQEKENPKEMNEWCKKNAYVQGCLLNMSTFAKLRKMTYEKVLKKPKVEKCLAETDYYKKSGVPQHFFLWRSKDGKIVDPLDKKPDWKKNPYPIVSWRVFKEIKPQKIVLTKSDSVVVSSTPVDAISKNASKIVQDESLPKNDTDVPFENKNVTEANMGYLVGYRTIISAVLQFLVTLGVISQTEQGALLDGVMGLVSLGLLVATIYFRIKANLPKK